MNQPIEEKEPMHVDDFIRAYDKDKYARWFLMLQRLPALMKSHFHEWIKEYKLFCTYEGKRYRCTGSSRLGDVWLTSDFNRDTGYELRVNVEDCTEWSSKSKL